ncbi:MAG: endonuclease/exonuclease/phosphatase family protein [Anaerolineales bacterium]|nr:endonuclease/exonuclease/phosphatase family protein [Anaerolineales bacterium]
MKKSNLLIIAFGFFFLFLIQMAGSLVESIYILDLMNTSLDEKALGLLFFFSPALLFFFRKKLPVQIVWVLFGLLFFARGFTPYLTTLGRMLASGIGTGAALLLFPFLLIAKAKDDTDYHPGLMISTGLALAVGLSVFLRTVNYSLDYSLLPEGSWVGWGMGFVLGLLLTLLNWTNTVGKQNNSWSVTLAVTGIFLVIGLVYFAFSAPAVIARWTEGNYSLIVMAVSLLAVGWIGLSLRKSRLIKNISPTWLLVWNLLFTISLVVTILAHRVSFTLTPDSPAVVVGAPTWLQQLPLGFMLLFFPVIFLDLRVFYDRIQDFQPTPRDLIPGMILGSLTLVLLVFMHIFTNVWGYVEPISPWFRNKFWLPYLLMTGLITLLIGRKGTSALGEQLEPNSAFSMGWVVSFAIIFLGTAGSALYTTRIQTLEPDNSSIVVMTYNIQQANDDFGERSYERQLALIRQIAPDILALQESDSSRISLNNNDFVRYYAGKLGYYSYYGPKTVTGTYGTAILSRYPLQNTRTVFSFSDQDEIGTAEAEIEIGGQVFTIYNVHPDGSDTALLTWANTLLDRSDDKENVIALGDFNLRDDEGAYQQIANTYINAWESIYPSKIGSNGTDMSGENRIDHIFLSRSLIVRNPVYVLPPDSATDHPVHWAEIYWKE